MTSVGGATPVAASDAPEDPAEQDIDAPPARGEGVWAAVRAWAPMFAAAVVARLVYWVLITPTYVPIADGDQYRRLGRRLAAGKGFDLVYPQLEMHPTAFRPPAYPALLAPGFRLFGSSSLWPARLTSVIVGSVAVVLIGVLASRIAGRRAGLIAAGIAVVYPPLLANDTVVMTESFALALLLGAIVLVDGRRWVWAGVVTGVLVLTRPNIYLVIVVLAVWLWRTVGWRKALGYAGCVLLVAFPWMLRNHIQVGTWRLTTSDGLTLAGIYAPPAQRAHTFVDPVFAADYGDLDHRLSQFDEVGWNDRLTQEAIDGVKAHKRYVWETVRRNFRGYFELDTHLNRFPEESDGRNWRFRQDTLVGFYLVTLLGLVGLARHWRDPRVIALAAIVAQFVVVSLLLVAPPRLRAPFDVAMCVGAGLLVAELVERWASSRARSAASP